MTSRIEHTNARQFFLLKLVHFTASIVLFYLFWLMFRYGTPFAPHKAGFRYNYFVGAGYAIFFYIFLRTYNGYLVGFSRIRAITIAQFISQFLSCGITYVIISLFWFHLYSPFWFIPLLIIQGLFDAFWSYGVTIKFYRLNPPKKTLFIYKDEIDKLRFGTIVGKPVGNIYRVEDEFQYSGNSFKKIQKKLEGYEALFVAGVDSRCRNGIIKYCVENHIPGFFLPHVGDVLMKGALHIQTFSSPVQFFSYKSNKIEYLFLKRLFDIVSSLTAIIILSPIMAITAALIKIYDGGPAIYKQVRLTKGAREFEIYKFRSMRVDAEKDGVARLSAGDKDDRITPIGKFVRKCRLDELPQLFNILKGDMSVVGPRPERPQIAEQYYKSLPEFALRLQVKAGLTGYAQVYGKYNSDPYEKLEFDLLYINDMNILIDLRLIFATFSILIVPESTEGIEAGATTAVRDVPRKNEED